MLLSPQDLQNFFWPRSAKKENAPCPKWQGVLACDPVGIQTQDLQNRNLTLYSAKLRDLDVCVAGFFGNSGCKGKKKN